MDLVDGMVKLVGRITGIAALTLFHSLNLSELMGALLLFDIMKNTVLH
jgi:hypothetical protein